MITDYLKIIAQFKDEASAGLQKLKGNLTGMSKVGNPLKGIETSRAAETIKRVDTEARKAATGGVKELGRVSQSFKNLFANIGQGFGGSISTITGGFEDISSAAGGAATELAATFAGVALASGRASSFLAPLADLKGVFAGIGQELGNFRAAATNIANVKSEMKALTLQAAEYKKQLSEGQNLEALRRRLSAAGIGARGLASIMQIRADDAVRLQRALAGLEKSSASAEARLKQLNAELNRANAATFRASLDVIKVGLIATTKIALGAAAAIAAVAGAISVSQRSAADDNAELAEKLGITVNQLEAYKIIANETGTSVEALTKTYDRLTKILDRTDEESDRAALALTNLGLSFEEVKKLKPEEQAALILKRYEDLGKTAEATASVQTLLGQSFRESSLGIKAVAGEFDEYADRVAKYGAGESKVLAAAGAEQEQAINDLQLAFKGLGVEIAENAGPLITTLIRSFADLTNMLRKTQVVGLIVNAAFSILNLVLVDFGRLLGGIGATLVAFFSGNFKDAWEIAKLTVNDAATALKNFGQRSQDTANQTVKAAEAEAASQKEKSAAAKAFAESEAKRLKARAAADAAAKKAAEEQLKIFNDAKQGLLQSLGLLGKETELERTLWETQKGRYKDLSGSQKTELLELASKIDLKTKELQLEQQRAALAISQGEQGQAIDDALELTNYASLNADARERQVFLQAELNRITQEGKGLDEGTLAAARAQAQSLADRQQALRTAQDEAATISSLIDSSQASIEKSVARNIDLARELLYQRKINEQDYARFVIDQTNRITSLNREAAIEVNGFWNEAARGIQQALATTFFDFMQGKLEDLGSSFKKVIDQMVANALAARLAQALFGADFEKGGDIGGFVGQGLSMLPKLFGGGKAGGGDVISGRGYVIGERGPEMFVPRTSGTILSNAQLTGNSMAVSVSINAVDSRSFLQQIDLVKREITDAVISTQRKYNMRTA